MALFTVVQYTVGWSDFVECFSNDRACSIVGRAIVRDNVPFSKANQGTEEKLK